MPRISANGHSVHYELDGPESAPVVTLSHSLSAELGMWDPQMAALGAYRVLRYDTRGHGRSEVTPGPYTLDQLADDAIALLAALGIAKTHFVGLSMGGMIGQTLALKRPDLLRSLVLCDTSSGYPPEAAAVWEQRIASARRDGLEPNVEPTIERWFSPWFVEQQPQVIERVRRMIRATPVDGYIGCAQAIAQLALTERLDEIRLPTLVVVGSDDPGTPVGMARVIHEGIAGSELVVLPGARHLANMEDVAGFNQALTRFIGRY